jgi:hypothetical protein
MPPKRTYLGIIIAVMTLACALVTVAQTANAPSGKSGIRNSTVQISSQTITRKLHTTW